MECLKKENRRRNLRLWTILEKRFDYRTSGAKKSGCGFSHLRVAEIEPATVMGTVTTISISWKKISRFLVSMTGIKNRSAPGWRKNVCRSLSFSTTKE